MASSTRKVVTSSSKRASKRSERVRTNSKLPTSKNYINKWSDYEKQVLLNLLYQHGDSDYEKLAESLPNKHVEQIKTYIRTVARRAQLAEEQRQKKETVKNLDRWIQLLGDIYGDIPVDDSLPYHLFTLTKQFSKPNNKLRNEIVDFQKAYEYLYTLAIGRKIDVDERTYYFVHSYIDWFLNEFENHIVQSIVGGTLTDLKTISEHNNSEAVHKKANELLNLTSNKLMVREFSLSYKCFLRHVCCKFRRTMFKKGAEYDRKISLVRADVDYEPQRNIDELKDNPPPSELVPKTTDFNFKNLRAFVLTALFNYSVDDLIHLSNQT